MRTHRIFLLIAAAYVSPVGSQQPAIDSATSAARANLRALARSDFRYVAQHSEPGELRRTRLAFDSLLRLDSANYIAQRLFRLDSTSQLRRLSDVDFAAGLMAFTFGINPAFKALATITDIEMPGSVLRGRDSALVIYRWVYPRDSLQTRNYNVEVMVRCGKEWCAQSAGNFSGIVRLLRESLAPERAKPPSTP